MSALYKSVSKLGQAPKLLKMTAPAVNKMQNRNLNLLEYQSKGLLQDFGVTVQKFKVRTLKMIKCEFGGHNCLSSKSKRLLSIIYVDRKYPDYHIT